MLTQARECHAGAALARAVLVEDRESGRDLGPAVLVGVRGAGGVGSVGGGRVVRSRGGARWRALVGPLGPPVVPPGRAWVSADGRRRAPSVGRGPSRGR